MEIKIEDYLTKSEIKSIVEQELRETISMQVQSVNLGNHIINSAYGIIFQEIEKEMPSAKEQIKNKAIEVINNLSNYSVFREAKYGDKQSLASSYIDEAVRENKELIKQKIIESVFKKDYSEDVWNRFEELADNFGSLIYEIAAIGKKKVEELTTTHKT